MVLLAIHGRFFLSFCFQCLLSALLCGSNLCTQVSPPVSKLEITRLLQPLYVFKNSRAHLRRCVFCSSVSKWGTHLAQTFLRSKRFFRIVCTLPSGMPVQIAISLTDNRASCSTTIFTAAMFALVTEVLVGKQFVRNKRVSLAIQQTIQVQRSILKYTLDKTKEAY